MATYQGDSYFIYCSPADGTIEWPFAFKGGYIDRAFVKMRYKDTNGTWWPVKLDTKTNFKDSNTLKISVPPSALVEIYRETTKDHPLVVYGNGGMLLRAETRNTAIRQSMHVIVELKDLPVRDDLQCRCDCIVADDLAGAFWSFPATNTGSSSYTAQMEGDPTRTYNIVVAVTGAFESRRYTDNPVVVGASGRFITASSSASAGNANDGNPWANTNLVMLTVSDPPQTFYLNQWLPVDTNYSTALTPDGSASWQLAFQATGTATITLSASDPTGTFYAPQYAILSLISAEAA